MKIQNFLILLLVLFVLAGCTLHKAPELDIEIVNQKSLKNLPSASGIVFHPPYYYVVGDDSPWLYRGESLSELTIFARLSGIDSTVNNRVPKNIKADFECMELFSHNKNEFLLVLSSGSKETSRDTAVLFSLESGKILVKRNLRPFYKMIMRSAMIDKDDQINIEGLAISDSMVYIFHRGNISGNLIIEVGKMSFYNYLVNNSQQIPEFVCYSFQLPVYNKLSSGFSGATVLPDNSGILFNASLEETNDVMNDGKVLGSYIGFMAFNNINENKFVAEMLYQNGQVLTKKLEGITIKNQIANLTEAIAVCDNDDGTSDIIELRLKFNQ